MDEFNTVNDVQGGNVDAEEEMDTLNHEPEEGEASEESSANASAEETSQEEQQNGGAAEGEHRSSGRDYERDHMFAEVRRNAENYGRQMAEAANAPLMQTLKNLGYEGSPQDMADAIEAANEGITVEEIRSRRNADAERIKNDPYVRGLEEQVEHYQREARNAQNREIYAKDLAEIKKAFPDCKVKSIDELGVKFAQLRFAGTSPTLAYQVIRAEEARTAPPVVGKTGSSFGKEPGYYSSSDVDNIERNHPEMLKDPKVLDDIMKSMSKW